MDLDEARINVKTVALNWYRDENGNDNTMLGSVSIGATISCVVWQGISAILHYFSLYSGSVPHGEVLHLPLDATRLRRRVAERCGPVSYDLEPTGELPLDEQYLNADMLTVPKSASVVRLLQRPVRRLVRRRSTLYVTDWVTARWSRTDPDGLALYRKSLVRSAIPAVSQRDLGAAGAMFPPSISHLFNLDVLNSTLRRHEIRWSAIATEEIVRYVNDVYGEIRDNLVRSTAQWLNMIRFYKPKRLYLPADAFEPWIILYQLCKERSIKTTMCVDGYMCLPLWPALRDPTNEDWLVDRALAYGEAQRDHILKTGFPVERVDLVNPPFLTYQPPKKGKMEFDAIVLTWIPYTVSPHADYSSPATTLRTALQVVASAGCSRIGVKIKSNNEERYVRRISTELGINVHILRGRFYQFARSAEVYVGGISTALAEVTAHGGRYVVFEPYENGYTDEMIDDSSVVSRETVFRDAATLEMAMASGKTSWTGDARDNLLVS